MFALSNVVDHKGEHNAALAEWAGKWNRHDLDFGYGNSNYHSGAGRFGTTEVLVTSY